jgi:RNA polymerase sigma-70 factor (ECF subfamily)
MNPGEKTIHKQKVYLVRKYVSKLPSKYKQLIIYRYFDELSYKEIAKKTMSPLGTIKVQLFRARELLFKILKDKKSII